MLLSTSCEYMVKRLSGILLAMGAVMLIAAAPAFASGEGIGGFVKTPQQKPIPGVKFTVKRGAKTIGTGVSDKTGRWLVSVPAPGKYAVTIDTATIPKGLTLRNIGGSTLPDVVVPAGSVQFVIFPLVPPSQAGHTTPHTSAFDQLAGLTLDGIELGLIIAMGAVGLSLIFGVTGLVNFAQGELVTFGGLAAWWLSTWGPGPGLPLVLAGILAVAAGAGLGFSLELGLFRPLRRRRTGNVSLIVVTIGLSLVLSNIFLIVVGGHPLQYAQYVIQTQVGPGPFTLTPKDWVIVGLGIVILATVGLLLQRTRYGTALRAVSDNPDLASSSGIGVERVILITWMGGAALAATGGVFLGIATAVEWDMGLEMLLLLFAAVVLGGIGTVYGAVLGALVIGIVTQVSTYWVNPEAKNAVAFLVLIAVLLVRPQGILGRRERVG
jgi:neutral amino acid transport system permease protein